MCLQSFFGRVHINPMLATAAECKTGDGRCVIDKKNRTSCKACRLKKCLAAGMSKSCSRYGRRSNWFKIHCLLQQQQQQQQQERRFSKGDHNDRVDSPPRRKTPLSLPVPVLGRLLTSPYFGFAPKSRTPLPRSEQSAFRETAVVASYGSGGSYRGTPAPGDDLPVDLTVRRFTSDGGYRDDDHNNNVTDGKYAARLKYEDICTTMTPLDLTSANRNFGIRSWNPEHMVYFVVTVLLFF